MYVHLYFFYLFFKVSPIPKLVLLILFHSFLLMFMILKHLKKSPSTSVFMDLNYNFTFYFNSITMNLTKYEAHKIHTWLPSPTYIFFFFFINNILLLCKNGVCGGITKRDFSSRPYTDNYHFSLLLQLVKEWCAVIVDDNKTFYFASFNFNGGESQSRVSFSFLWYGYFPQINKNVIINWDDLKRQLFAIVTCYEQF